MARTKVKQPKAESAADLAIKDWATALFNSGKVDEAATQFKALLKRNKKDPFAIYHVSLIYFHKKQYEEALPHVRNGVAVAPGFAPMWFAQAMVLQALGRYEKALESYDRAIKLQPDYLEALLNSGVLLREMLKHHQSLERFERILAISPNHEKALGNCATLLSQFERPEASIAMFKRLLDINPTYPFGPGLLCYERMRSCDWTDFEKLAEQIHKGMQEDRAVCKGLSLMAISASAADHFLNAKIFARDRYPKSDKQLWNGEVYNHKRLRIAYVSPDFRQHPVGYLMSGIFERHDKSKFETIGISIGIDDGSALRTRIIRSFEHFIDASGRGSLDIAKTIKELEVDILIDLAGYTSDARVDIFSYRAAPLQITYLGYPGTLANGYFDYILADRQIIPEDHQKYYSEKVAYLPNAYLPTDCGIQISEQTPTRAEAGLPESGPVLCSFSHDFKIHPVMFEAWMRLLNKIPDSVLWLASRPGLSRNNLKAAAEKHGIDPSRLVFADRTPRIEDHLARYRLADVFLDTFPYNAHTTAADALMSGLPVVTMMGDSFPSRVAGSLLHAIGAPELIVGSMEAYEALVIKLVSNPELLTSIKQKLIEHKKTYPLFDTDRFCKDLEATLASLHEAHRSVSAQQVEYQ